MSQCRNTQKDKMADEQVRPFLNQIGCHIFPFRTVLLGFNRIVLYFLVFRELVKLMFSKKATKIDEIFTVYLTLCSKCQIHGEDFVNFCGLLRKHEF